MLDEAAAAEDNFAIHLRHQRRLRGLSQAQLAKLMEEEGIRIHPQTIFKIENGTQRVKLNEAAAIASCLDLPLGDLISREGNLSVAQGWRQAILTNFDASTAVHQWLMAKYLLALQLDFFEETGWTPLENYYESLVVTPLETLGAEFRWPGAVEQEAQRSIADPNVRDELLQRIRDGWEGASHVRNFYRAHPHLLDGKGTLDPPSGKDN
ncbi:helix-turn-helix transcriptional regulator [Nesterenkonia ebinurensis]|uniref:helix-turn-helix transcriptional regulator n=1 Tax=Nesterenkonia ebinurensis TaxID=2608252 RepID=UPI00123CA175|nr:helix-turn-helix transcriptional regulator [Nesterenkonia ebinurensis]